jgi:SAM-dependent methyltransferase
MIAALEQFRTEYADRRAREGRAHRGAELRSLPYLREGPLARQWAVRARTFDAFVREVVTPMERGRRLHVLDLGAGNGWLSYRLALRGHRCTAIDLRDDTVDGLGAAQELRRLAPFACLVGSFDAMPLSDRCGDLAVFNASLHYARDLGAALAEARRCLRPGGAIAVLDSPFYPRPGDGEAMVREKRRNQDLATIDCIEFVTAERLAEASGLAWHRHRVRYPLWYEMRPFVARLRGERRPSRFDFWTAKIP